MSGQSWTDRIAGDRMAVDGEFTERVNESRFSSQQWGLIMTATEFEINEPDDPERAELVADTSSLPQIMPELDKIDPPVGPGGGTGGTGGSSESSSGGFLSSIKGALGFDSSGGDDEQLRAAEELVAEYADRLQERLEERGKWESIREQAAGDQS